MVDMEPARGVIGPSGIHPDFNLASFHTDVPSADLNPHPSDGHPTTCLYGDSDTHAASTDRDSASATYR